MCKLKVRPVFVSKKLGEQLRIREKSQNFLLSNALFISSSVTGVMLVMPDTCQHLYQPVDEHKATVVGKHLKEMCGQDCTS